MSKLLDKLERISESNAQPMGFTAALARVKSPPMVLVASLSQGDTDAANIIARGGADAVLVAINNLAKEAEQLQQIIQVVADFPWGARLQRVTKEEVTQLLEMGCDFLVFEGVNTPSAILREEGIGKVLQIDPSISDSLARAIERLPVDAVLITEGLGKEPSLTVSRLMSYQRLANLLRKPMLTALPGEPQEGDLEGLWEVGIRGVLLDTRGSHPEERLSAVQKAIQALPPARKKPREKMDVFLPLPIEPTQPSPPDEEED